MWRTGLVCGALALALSPVPAFAASAREIPIDVRRLSDRVMVLTDPTLGGNNVVALASARGLVVIDTSSAPAIAARIRAEIESTFGRKDFTFVVNTHEDFDHVSGNQVFADATLVGHDGCRSAVQGFRARSDAVVDDRIAWQQQHLANTTQRLSGLVPGSDDEVEARRSIARSERLIELMAEGVDFTPPAVTFNDTMSLDLGDLTVNLLFFGSAHSRSDTLVEVPEEGLLMTGDLFSEGVPGFNVGEAQTLDVPRCLQVLDAVLAPETHVSRVVLGHRDIWPRAMLESRVDCARAVWDGVRQAWFEGLGLEATLRRLPLESTCPGVPSNERLNARLEAQHAEMVRVFRRQLQSSAAAAVEEALRAGGTDAARMVYEKAKLDPTEAFSIDENEFNALGYQLLQAGSVDEAITVFAINADAFPESWNAWDSLGEAYMTRGDRARAIECYRASLQRNPDNRNGGTILERLTAEEEAERQPTQ
jgi:glyoxylase-like metal-dependent hydrolase (beta-lactamase superfamily II)